MPKNKELLQTAANIAAPIGATLALLHLSRYAFSREISQETYLEKNGICQDEDCTFGPGGTVLDGSVQDIVMHATHNETHLHDSREQAVLRCPYCHFIHDVCRIGESLWQKYQNNEPLSREEISELNKITIGQLLNAGDNWKKDGIKTNGKLGAEYDWVKRQPSTVAEWVIRYPSRFMHSGLAVEMLENGRPAWEVQKDHLKGMIRAFTYLVHGVERYWDPNELEDVFDMGTFLAMVNGAAQEGNKRLAQHNPAYIGVYPCPVREHPAWLMFVNNDRSNKQRRKLTEYIEGYLNHTGGIFSMTSFVDYYDEVMGMREEASYQGEMVVAV